MTLMHYLGLPSPMQAAYLLGIKQSTPERILTAVSSYTGVGVEAIKGRSRNRGIVEARYISMHLIRSTTNKSLASVGRLFGRDHSTVIYAREQVADWLKYDSAFKRKYKSIIERL